MTKEHSRINLTPEASASVKEMLGEIEEKHECVRLTASGLVSWIVLEFRKGHFEKQKGVLAKAYFDRRAYLKRILKSADDDKMDEALRRVLKENQRGKNKIRKGK